MSKKNLIFGFFLLTSMAFVAQRDRIEYLPTVDKIKLHYGFYLGINQNDFKLNLKESSFPNANITVVPKTGFNVGLIADLRLHKNISLRLEPGLASNSKNIYFNHIETEQDSVREIVSTYLRVPLIFKFSTDRLNNIRPFLLAGVSYDYNFSSREKSIDDNSNGDYFRMKSNNFMYEVGIGIDIYLFYFKFSPSIRGVFAMNNEVKYDNITTSNGTSKWTDPINFLGTRGVFLNFSFEN